MKIFPDRSYSITIDFVSATDLLQCIDVLGGVIRVELNTSEFKKLLSETDIYDPVGIRSDSPKDYSGCYVLIGNKWCVQTHRDYI